MMTLKTIAQLTNRGQIELEIGLKNRSTQNIEI